MGHAEDCKHACLESIMILFFEMLGTAMLTSIYNCSLSQLGGFFTTFIGFFIVLIMGANISGSHYNPAVTLAFMFRQDNGRFRRLLGILYIVAQFLGGIFGGFISYILFGCQDPIGIKDHDQYNVPGIVKWYWSQGMFADCFGGCLLVFIYLTQTEAKTRLANDPAITMLIISGSYIVSTVIGRSSAVGASPINPAIAVGLIAAEVLSGNYVYAWGWVLILFPVLGGILGLIIFECIYKKTSGAVKEEEEVDKEGAEQIYTGGALRRQSLCCRLGAANCLNTDIRILIPD